MINKKAALILLTFLMSTSSTRPYDYSYDYGSTAYRYRSQNDALALWLSSALIAGSLTPIVGLLWYNRLSPYTPYLQISTQGIATNEKQVAWHQVQNIQKTIDGGLIFYSIRYAKTSTITDTLIIYGNYLPCSEEELFNLFETYKKKSVGVTQPPSFSTTPFNEEQLKQFKATGIYKNEDVAIICHHKLRFIPLTILSVIVYGWLIGSVCGVCDNKAILFN